MPDRRDAAPRTAMRYLTWVLRPIEKTHPIERALAESSALRAVAIHQTKLLEDSTCVTLLQIRGDLTNLNDVLGDHTSVIEYAIAGERDGFVFLRSETHDLARHLLRVQAESELIVQMPLRHTNDGGLRGTAIGTDEAFQWAVDSLPDELTLQLESIGDYHPDMRQPFYPLTERQQEILSIAVREGYYEDPRRISQRELAERLEIAPETVSQHLQRIEAKIFSEYPSDASSGKS